MIFEHKSYRSYLKDLLVQRKRVNASYSLRAFAAALGFSSSHLSEVLNGKTKFSDQSLKKIAKKLKLNSREMEYLVALGGLESDQDNEYREEALNKLQRLSPRRVPFSDLTIDKFKQIADWRHSAILELIYLKNFDFDATSIARRLNLPRPDVELALDRLERLELLRKTDDLRYERVSEALQIQLPEKNAAMRTFYRDMFKKASDALDEQTPHERWSGYETIPVAIEALPEIRQACDSFLNEVLRIAERYDNKTEVYHIFTHLFNLTPTKDRK